MKIDLTKCSKLELETIMDNACKSTKSEAPDVYRAAAIELARRGGGHCSDPVIAGCWGAITLLDRCRYKKTGKRYKAQYSLRSIRRNGEIAFMTDCARGKTQGTGFMLLVEAGLGHCTVEYIVVANPDRFPQDAVHSARARLIGQGVAVPTN